MRSATQLPCHRRRFNLRQRKPRGTSIANSRHRSLLHPSTTRTRHHAFFICETALSRFRYGRAAADLKDDEIKAAIDFMLASVK
jgi:hypothetical protein